MSFFEEELGATQLETERAEKYERLYHYTAVEGLKGILDSGSLWVTQIQYMNDSKEFGHAVDIALELIKRRKVSASTQLAKFYSVMENTLYSSNGARTFIFSMTENPDQLSQWRGYCGLGGYSIGFNKSALQELCSSSNFRLEKCVYDDSEKERVIGEVIDGAVDYFNSQNGRDDYDVIEHESKFYGRFLKIGSTMKHSSFVEEQEWRLIGGPFPWTDQQSQWRTRDGVLLPYYEVKLERDADGYLPVSEVYIGPCKERQLAADSLHVYMQVTKNLFRRRFSKTPYRG